ncbi:MAG: SGNH/GDSL hydrolase family protein, partial [Bacteroidaceae bacterium]
MRTTLLLFLSFLPLLPCMAQPTTLLYEGLFFKGPGTDIVMEDSIDASYSSDGILIQGNKGKLRLDRYYSLGQRTARFVVRFSPNAVAQFYTDNGDIVFRVDMAQKRISQENKLPSWKQVDWLLPADEYLVEMVHDYAVNSLRITSLRSGQSESLVVVNDGPGGYGKGELKESANIGCQWDYYCVSLLQGTSMTVKQMNVVAGACNLTLLIYGDSITQPEWYYPAKDFPHSWTQLVIAACHGKAMTSGRNGCTIGEVLLRIKNELPFVKAKYVMVTIGTNGGNTEENLSDLVDYILAQGSIPILNNIPCNEENDQVHKNEVIERVRQKYGLRGCRLDVATSLHRDGKEVDKSLMFYEDWKDVYGKDFYHHPNVEGARRMFLQTLVDVP